MDPKRSEQHEDDLAQLVEAQARGEQAANLDLPVEQEAPQDTELDTRVSKYGQSKGCSGDGR